MEFTIATGVRIQKVPIFYVRNRDVFQRLGCEHSKKCLLKIWGKNGSVFKGFLAIEKSV